MGVPQGGSRAANVLNAMEPKLFIVDDHLSILRTLECALPLLLPLLLPCTIAARVGMLGYGEQSRDDSASGMLRGRR
jgi:hypothetical protein